jgi:hypothetical protein
MNGPFDRHEIAARIRGLIAGQDGGDLAVVAGRLGVDEVGLRMSLDDLAPNPTVDVIAALVEACGVDPCWLLTGEYDPATHRAMAESRESAAQAVSRLMAPAVDQFGNTIRLL